MARVVSKRGFEEGDVVTYQGEGPEKGQQGVVDAITGMQDNPYLYVILDNLGDLEAPETDFILGGVEEEEDEDEEEDDE